MSFKRNALKNKPLSIFYIRIIISVQETMSNTMYSLSFNSQDVLYTTEDGAYVFRMTAHAPRAAATRVMLGTLELPLTQFPVESSWNRVYFSEGLRLTDSCHKLRITENYPYMKSSSSFEITLPVYQRENQSVTLIGASEETGLELEVTTVDAHCMWVIPAGIDQIQLSPSSSDGFAGFDPTRANLAQEWTWGDPIRLVGTSLGDVAFHPAGMEFIDAKTFRVKGARCSACKAASLSDKPSGWTLPNAGYLHTPTIPGPLQLASILQRGLQNIGTEQNYTVSVDATTGGLLLCAESLAVPQGAFANGVVPWTQASIVSLQLMLGGDDLAAALGIYNISATWKANTAPDQWDPQGSEQARNLPTASSLINPTVIRPDDASSLPLPEHAPYQIGGTNGFRGGVGVAALPVGWYDISARPVGAAGRHSFSQSWTMAINPLYLAPPGKPLPPTDPNTNEHLTSHWFIHFIDSMGEKHRVMVPAGNYDIESLCELLSASMSLVSAETSSANVSVTFVTEQNDTTKGRFKFSLVGCGNSKEVVPAPCMFALDFSHPMATLDPGRLGFSKTLYSGSSSYISPHAVAIPDLQLTTTSAQRPPQGVWGAELIGEQRRLRFTCNPRSDMVVLLKEINADSSITFWVRTVDGRPIGHGFQEGDIVQLRQSTDALVVPKFLVRKEDTVQYDWDPIPQTTALAPTDTTLSINLPVISNLPTSNIDERLDGCFILTVKPPQYILVDGVEEGINTCLSKGTWYLCSPKDVYPSLYLDTTTCPGTILPEMLGLPAIVPSSKGESGFMGIAQKGMRQTALVWGTVGDVSLVSQIPGCDDDTSRPHSPLCAWPLSAWSVYRFDPPEICLVYFNEGRSKGSAFLQHVSGSNVTMPFARINLGSLHREGGLKSEIISTSGEALTVFHLRFANPNGTRYHMHNSWFSFTLNVLS